MAAGWREEGRGTEQQAAGDSGGCPQRLRPPSSGLCHCLLLCASTLGAALRGTCAELARGFVSFEV